MPNFILPQEKLIQMADQLKETPFKYANPILALLNTLQQELPCPECAKKEEPKKPEKKLDK